MERTHRKSRQVGRTEVRLRETKEIALSFETLMGNVATIPRSLRVQRQRFPPFIAPRELLSGWQSTQLGHWEITYDVQEQLINISNQLDILSTGLSSIREELDDCKKSVTELHEKLEARPIVKQTNITEIGDNFKVKIPIPVTIEEYDDEVMASVSEIELFASGTTEAEALLRLKREIVSLYGELSETPKEQLGNLLIRYLRILENLVEKNG
jgi:hypothetical protein